MKSFSGERNVSKSKGFSLDYSNQQVYNFETLKNKILSKAIDEQKDKLVLHTNKAMMTRRLFDIQVLTTANKSI